MKKLITILLVTVLTSCGDSLSTVDDKSLKSFEDLERRKVITIERGLFYNTFTKIEWDKLTREDAKLLFSNKLMRDLFVKNNKKIGIDITSRATKASLTGRFRMVVLGYDDALEELKKSSKE
jgi:hypothetical protein